MISKKSLKFLRNPVEITKLISLQSIYKAGFLSFKTRDLNDEIFFI